MKRPCAVLVLTWLACAVATPAACGPRAPAEAPMVDIRGGAYPIGRERGRPDERPVHSVTLAEVDGERVTRGGDHVFDSTPEHLRASFRAGFSRAPAVGRRHLGFRCAR